MPWNIVVMDEAHKLRNARRKSHETGPSFKRSLAGRKKLLLTATPLQNAWMAFCGLSALVDEPLFGDERGFRSRYSAGEGDLASDGFLQQQKHLVALVVRQQAWEPWLLCMLQAVEAASKRTTAQMEPVCPHVASLLPQGGIGYLVGAGQPHAGGILLDTARPRKPDLAATHVFFIDEPGDLDAVTGLATA